jgi:hypothetical protein
MFDNIEARTAAAERAILASVGIVLDPRDRIVSRGATPEEAARAWCGRTGQSFGVSMDQDSGSDGGRLDWCLRFTADGDSMKSAGVVLPDGACLMTWLK